MADNTTINAGSGGDTISTDDLGSVKVQRVKVQYGTDGNATDVSSSFPLPVTFSGATVDLSGTATVTGNVNISATANIVGVVDLSATANIVGTVNISATATVTGNVNISATATVTGNVNISATATVTGNINVSATANTVVTSALPAGSSLIGAITLDSNQLYAGALVTPKFAAISMSASGTNVVVAAVAAKKIRVLNYTLVSTSTNNVQWYDGVTAISGAMDIAAYGGVSTAASDVGLFETTASGTLGLAITGSTQVSGHLTYIEV